jgi:putative glutamine amidotransferase
MRVSTEMRPLVIVPCHTGLQEHTRRPIYYNNKAYIHAIERAGGVPVLIPILEEPEASLQSLLPHMHGLLLSGGLDVDPCTYGQEHRAELGETHPALDRLELSLVHWAVKEGVPTLGICRGMQLINVALGGHLYQDLASEYPGSLRHDNWHWPRNKIAHQVHVEPGSRMQQVLRMSEVPANSLHHQAVSEPGEGVVISGRAEDGVAELLEMPAHPFMLAVQCHPEELVSSAPVWSRLFEAFIEACRQNAAATHAARAAHMAGRGC